MEKNLVVCFISSPKIPSPMDIIQHENSTISDSVSCGPAGTIRSWCLRSQIFHLIFVNFLQSWYSAFIYNLQIVRTFWQTRAFKNHIFQLISGTLWILKPNLKRWFLLKGLGLYIKTWYAIVEYSCFFFFIWISNSYYI